MTGQRQYKLHFPLKGTPYFPSLTQKRNISKIQAIERFGDKILAFSSTGIKNKAQMFAFASSH